MPQLNTSVLAPRLLNLLRQPGMESSSATIHLLLRFKDDAALRDFVADPAAFASKLGASAASFKVIKVIPELRHVSATIEAQGVGDLSVTAPSAGVSMIDENPKVTALVTQVPLLKETRGAITPKISSRVSPLGIVDQGSVYGLTGKGITVAVLDTGIDGAHPDLDKRVRIAKDLSGDGTGDRVGHGTHVAGLIAGTGKANSDFLAPAWEADLIDVKVLNDQGFNRADGIMEGIVWAVKEGKANILSLSLGTPGDYDGTEPLSQSVEWAVSQGVCVFVAAGNCGPSGSEISCPVRGPRSITSPGVAKDVITIGATDLDGNVAGFSSRGPTLAGLTKPDVVICGTDVTSARATGVSFGKLVDQYYTKASGTSMATPRCAAIGALVLQAAAVAGVSVSPADMKAIFLAAAQAIPQVAPTWQGAGVVDAPKVLRAFYAKYGITAPGTTAAKLSVSLQSGSGTLEIGVRTPLDVVVTNNSTELVKHVNVTAAAAGARVETRGASALAVDALQPGESASDSIWVTPLAAGAVSIALRSVYEVASASSTVEETDIAVQVAPATPAVTPARVQDVISRARELLLSRQRTNGTWTGDIMFNSWTNGLYCLLYKILRLGGEPTATLQWLESHRNGLNEQGTPDGTFGIVDEPSIHMVEATLVAEVALEVWGRPRDQRAWDFIKSLSAARLADVIANTDPFTQVFVSLVSDLRPSGTTSYYSVDDVTIPPIELLAIPGFVSASLANLFAAWGQDAVAALAAIGTVCKEKNPTVLHRVLLAKAERQLLRNQCSDGSWYDTILPTIACTLGMHMLGYANDHPVMVNALRFINSRLRTDGYLTRYELPVWDSAIAIMALREAGLPANDRRLIRAADYLVSAQTENGGIPFTRENVLYPDTDDTSFGILALDQLDYPLPEIKRQVTERGIAWLLYMQGNTGGWAAFAKDQAVKSPDRAPVFKDDPPTADVTGHVLWSLKLATDPAIADRVQDAKQRGFEWLRTQQLEKGGWYGRWGMTVTYGITSVLQAIGNLNDRTDQTLIDSATHCLVSMQQADGGWGEGSRTYYDVNATEVVPSSIEQTAWSVMGLLSVPVTPVTRPAVERGIEYLLDRFDPMKGWGEGSYVVGALWIYKNSLYPLMWSLWALAKYQNVTRSAP